MSDSKWIPVIESLPKKEAYYKVKFFDGLEDEKPFRIRPRRNIHGFMSEKKITHWQELIKQ